MRIGEVKKGRASFLTKEALAFLLLYAAAPALADECTGGGAGTVSVTTTTLSFTDYNARDSAVDTASFTVTAACSGGSGGSVLPPLTVALAAGDGSYTQREMLQGAHVLDYQIFTNAGLTDVWGDGSGATSLPSTAGGAASQDFPGYGAIPPGQWVTAGSYADEITVTVSY
jgi:spore coat protein U-like protein